MDRRGADPGRPSRRGVLLALGAGALGACVPARDPTGTPAGALPRAAFFEGTGGQAILVSTADRRLAFWDDAGGYLEFPVGIGAVPEFDRHGLTRIVRKRANPSWTPTPSQRARDPSLPAFVPPGPDNPMGLHALYLSWQYFAIHGTPAARSVGARGSSGCFRLYQAHAARLYGVAEIGCPVRVVPDSVAALRGPALPSPAA